MIFHCTSDIHGVLFAAKERGCMAKLASYFEVSRNQEDITVDCGDLLQGSYDANSTQGDLIVRAFNLLNYDFFVPGNHDLEFGAASLRRNLEKMNATVLCANFKFKTPLAKMKPYVVIERKNMRIGIIGTGERESRTRMLYDDSMIFMNEEKVIAECLRDLRREKVDMIVLVRHGGIYFSGGSLFDMLKKFPEIDLVIGGHSHKLERGRKIAGAYYVQPGAYCEGVIQVKVDFDDRTRKIRRITSDYHLLAKYENSRAFTEKLSVDRGFYRAAYRRIPHDLPYKFTNIRQVQKYLIEKYIPQKVKADAYLFFIDESNYKWRGSLNKYLLFRMFPFENNVVTLDVNAAEYGKIVDECRKYSQKYKVEMFFKPSNKKYLKLCTTSFVLSGGGRNFSVSRKIAEKNRHNQIQYQSVRKIVQDSLGGE